MAFKVNGELVKVATEPGTWAVIDRVWKNGDRVEMEMTWSLKEVPVDYQHPGRVAIADGPVVLVERQKSALSAGLSSLKESGSGCYKGRSGSESSFIPFYSVKYGEPYAMYVDL
jgi:hypothetical protein